MQCRRGFAFLIFRHFFNARLSENPDLDTDPCGPWVIAGGAASGSKIRSVKRPCASGPEPSTAIR
jgi:hypothetical protein